MSSFIQRTFLHESMSNRITIKLYSRIQRVLLISMEQDMHVQEVQMSAIRIYFNEHLSDITNKHPLKSQSSRWKLS